MTVGGKTSGSATVACASARRTPSPFCNPPRNGQRNRQQQDRGSRSQTELSTKEPGYP